MVGLRVELKIKEQRHVVFDHFPQAEIIGHAIVVH
jgi:hypothetical protein